ncbi:hypothetical protein L915_17209 [Phytophthora nicotianae]|uniref:Uncharacterized protein n=2 Tax=Phytophthora nicotianae TaxID=4792 RepID=W2G246_PHYNI|nr:hypothetical protein L915_17209 [Phytophthora nicotianae]
MMDLKPRCLDSYVKSDDSSRNVYHWLDWIIMENRELSMCEKIKTRKYTHLKPLSVNTLKKHMLELETVVQTSIRPNLKERRWALQSLLRRNMVFILSPLSP